MRVVFNILIQSLLLGLLTTLAVCFLSYAIQVSYQPSPLFLPLGLLFAVMCGCLVFIVGSLTTYLDQKH